MSELEETKKKKNHKKSSKKKKEKKESVSLLSTIDNNLNKTYDEIRQEIEDIQIEIYEADKKALKKAKKKIKKSGEKEGKLYADKIRLEIRQEALQKLEGNNLLDRVEKCLRDIAPIVVLIGRLIASLILSILSVDAIKVFIKPELLDKMNSVYKFAMAI